MPFTPYYFGPGLAVNAVAPRYFSFSAFVFSRVLTDIEPLCYLPSGEAPIHRFFHTCAGATLVGAVSYLVGRPLCGFRLARLRHTFGWRLAGLHLYCLVAGIVGLIVLGLRRLVVRGRND
jgi:hypothetical protein